MSRILPRIAAALLALLVLAGPLAADPATARLGPAKAAPPAFFQKLVSDLPAAGFHRNTDEKAWQAGSVCVSIDDRATTACKRIRAAWVVSVVSDRTTRAGTPVQELWLFELDSIDDAKRAGRSLEKDFPYGPFAKHPFRVFVHGSRVLAVEGRARWHSEGKRLEQHVRDALVRLPSAD